jgi:hypothetical protein
LLSPQTQHLNDDSLEDRESIVKNIKTGFRLKMKEADIIRDSEADPGSKPEEVDVDRLLGEFVQLRID